MKRGVSHLSIRGIQRRMLSCGLLAAAMLAGLVATASAQSGASQPDVMPSGQYITPLAPTGATFSKLNPGLKDFPSYTVGQAVKTVISPDGNTLLILTSGFNRLNDDQGRRADADSNEYVFVFDVAHGSLRQAQVLQMPNTFFGLAFSPDGNRFYVSGGVDDNIHVFARGNGVWAESGAPVTLGHKSGTGFHQKPMVANLAVTANGRFLVAADIADDDLSIVDLDSRAKVGELDLREGNIHAPRAGEDSILTAAENGAVSAGGDSDQRGRSWRIALRRRDPGECNGLCVERA
jgi:DNA-binding beta-propeller fold protein YncE